jgi:hypothetical protein
MSFNTIRDLSVPPANFLKDEDLLAIADFDSAITYKISVHELMQLQQVFSKDVKGLVPGPTEAEIVSTEILVADGNWRPISYFANSKTAAGVVSAGGSNAHAVWMTDASGNPAWRSHRTFGSGHTGLVPGPTATEVAAKEWLNADGTWRPLPVTPAFSGASSSTAGTSGLVPAPSAGSENAYLKGDGSWGAIEMPTSSVESTGWVGPVSPGSAWTVYHGHNTTSMLVEVWVSAFADGRNAHRVEVLDYDTGLEVSGVAVIQTSNIQFDVQLSKAGFNIMLEDGQNTNGRYDAFTYGFWVDGYGRVSWQGKYIKIVYSAKPNPPALTGYPSWQLIAHGNSNGAGTDYTDFLIEGQNYADTVGKEGSYIWFQALKSGGGCEEIKLNVEWKTGNPYGNQQRLVFLEGGCGSSHGPMYAHLLHQTWPLVSYTSKWPNYTTTFNAGDTGTLLGNGYYSMAIILPHGHIRKLNRTWVRSNGYGGKLDNPCAFYEWSVYFFEGVDIGTHPRDWFDSLYKDDGSTNHLDITHDIPLRYPIGTSMPDHGIELWIHGGYRLTPPDGSLDILDSF